MIFNFWSRIQGKSLYEIYLYINEKIVRSKRCRSYKRVIVIAQPPRNDIQLPYISEAEISDIDVYLADLYCDHIFNLLGSGPNKLNRKQTTNINRIQNISSFELTKIEKQINFLNSNYEAIEWQEDFKNKFLFDELQSSETIKNNESNGYDIKIPWELARCQHLPFLARIYVGTGMERYRTEILCEILDFILYNPIGYGVNWKCTMDVAIRISNWIMALDIIQEKLDEGIQEIIVRSIYQHCIYIRYHLEDQRDYRGNHYLSDIVGLLFSSTFFLPEGEIRKIQEFAIEKLLESIDEQFYKDGGNFESSLPYHRLSLELVIYGLWRILVLSDCNDLCKQYSDSLETHKKEIDKVGRAFKLMLDAIKPNCNIYQLGDNDSGHLFRFYRFGEILSKQQYENRYNREILPVTDVWDENELCCKEIETVINSVLGNGDHKTILAKLLGTTFQSSGISPILWIAFRNAGNENLQNKLPVDRTIFPFEHSKIINFDNPIGISDVSTFYYSEFGLVGLKSDSFYLSVSITGVGQRGRGGHSHNDKLSYELFADGMEYEHDPGTYVYTESREWRNRFRSSLAHNGPYFGEEQNKIGENCFELRQRTECDLMELTEKVIQVSCKFGNIYVIRRFELSDNQLIIKDYSNTQFKKNPDFVYFSNGYGKILKQKENKIK